MGEKCKVSIRNIRRDANDELKKLLNEEYKNIVFFSIWQLPNNKNNREQIYKRCKEMKIVLHFATERLSTDPSQTSLEDIEMLFRSELMIQSKANDDYLQVLSRLI